MCALLPECLTGYGYFRGQSVQHSQKNSLSNVQATEQENPAICTEQLIAKHML